jgi:hypothetical protein
MGHLSLLRLGLGLGKSGLQLLGLSGLALSSLVGCGGGDDGKKDGQDPGTTAVVDQVELDGFLLVMVNGGLALLDPETGETSAETLDLSGEPNPSNHFSVSPNGRQIAFESSAHTLKIADITFEGGVPGFEIVRELTGAGYGRPRYTPDGLRIVTTNVAVDPATGDTWACSDEEARYPLVALAGGHRYVCQTTSELKEDGDVLASGASLTAVSADGQFSDMGTHVPSGTRREINNTPVSGGVALEARFPLADGTFAELYGSASGERVTESPGGFVTIYNRTPIDNEQRDGRYFDIKKSFEAGDWSKAEGETWPLRDAGFPLLSDGDGRVTSPIGVSQDERHVLFGSSAWVITGDQYTNALYETVIESAFSVVDRDGNNERTYRTTSLGDVALIYTKAETDVEGAVLFQPELFQDTAVVDFGDGNLLVPIGGYGLAGSGWGGYFDGKPYIVHEAGRMSRDGRWFVVAGGAVSPTDLRLCFMEVGATSKRCLSTSIGGVPQTIVGYGLKSAHAKDAPEVLATSRSSAWPGSTVSIFGVRFGDSGTVHIGDAEVADADISSWSDDHIEFTVSEELPEAGQIVVETAQGKGGTARQFWLHRSRLVETPFDGIHVGTIALGQGLNVVDLGGYEAEDGKGPPDANAVFSSQTRLDTGEYVIYSPGSEEPMKGEIELVSGGFSHRLYFQLENRLADDTKWQLVQPTGLVDLNNQYPGFRRIAGDLVESAIGAHPLVGERITLASFASRIPGTVAANFGAPDYWREGEDGKGAWVLNKIDNITKGFAKVTDWNAQPAWGTPTFAASPQAALLPFLFGVEAAGQVLVLTGSDLMGSGKAGFQLSSDGGATFGAMTLVDETLGNPSSSLVEPIRIAAKAGTFFLTLETLGASDVAGVHAISTEGVLSKDATEVPAGAKLFSGVAAQKPTLDYVSVGGKLLLHFPVSHTLFATDFDAPGEATKTWTPLPSAADAGHVLNIWQDPKSAVIYAIKDDGQVVSSPGDAFADPAAWEEVDLGIELALPTVVQPLAVARLDDGRWFVLADLNDAKNPSARSPFGETGFLVGPKP